MQTFWIKLRRIFRKLSPLIDSKKLGRTLQKIAQPPIPIILVWLFIVFTSISKTAPMINDNKKSVIPQKCRKLSCWVKRNFKFSCFFKSYIIDNMDENDILASLLSITLRSFEHFPRKRQMTNYVTNVNFWYGIDCVNKNQYILGLMVIKQK